MFGLRRHGAWEVTLALLVLLRQCSAEGGDGQAQKRTELRLVLGEVIQRGCPQCAGFTIPGFVACGDLAPCDALQDFLLILIQAHSEGTVDPNDLDLVRFYLGHADLLIEAFL